jgi:hypothetical protein
VLLLTLALPSIRTRLGFVQARGLSYPLGGQIDLPAGVYARTSRTLVIFARTSCVACQHAKPVFTEIAAALSKYHDVRVVMVTGEQLAADETKFAAEMGLDASALIRMDLDPLRLRVVPTTVLVDARGAVLYSTEGGELSDDDRAAILRLAGAPTTR